MPMHYYMEMLMHQQMMKKKTSHFVLQMRHDTSHRGYIAKRTLLKGKREVEKVKEKEKEKVELRFMKFTAVTQTPVRYMKKKWNMYPDFIDAKYVDNVGATKLISLDIAVRVKKCYTCNHLFDRDCMVPPYDLIFSRKTKRLRPDGKGGNIRGPKPTPAFFCTRDMACLEFEFPSIKKKDIYMGNLTFNSLTRAHKKYLKIKGYWEPILHNRHLRASFR